MCYEDNIFQGNSQEDAHKLALIDLFALIRFPSLASLPLPLPSFSRFLFFFRPRLNSHPQKYLRGGQP